MFFIILEGIFFLVVEQAEQLRIKVSTLSHLDYWSLNVQSALGLGSQHIRVAPHKRCHEIFWPGQPTHQLANHVKAWNGATGVQLAAGGRYAGVNSGPGVEPEISHISHLLQFDLITCALPRQVFPLQLAALGRLFLSRYL